MVDDQTVVDGQTTEPAASENSAPPAEQTAQNNQTAPEQAAAATPPGDGTAAAAPAESGGQRDTKAERRIGQLSSRAKRAEETVQTLESENTALKQQLESQAAPKPEDFATDAEYTAALIGHATTSSRIEGQIDSNTREVGRVQADSTAERLDEVKAMTAEFAAKTPDYVESVAKIGGLPNIAASVMQLDNVAQVYYALSKNLQLAVQLEAMPETQRLVELGRLSAGVTPQVNNISSAPAPVASAANGGGVPADGDPSKMSMEEFNAWHDGRRTAT